MGLRTKDARQAASLFLQANAELEARFEQARERLRTTGSPLPSSRDRATALIQAYVNGSAKCPGGLGGAGRLELARREIDRGLWNLATLPGGATGCCAVSPSTSEEWAALAGNAALFATHRGTVEHIADHPPGAVWLRRDPDFAGNGRAGQLARWAEQIAFHADFPVDELRDELEAFLDVLPTTPMRSRRTNGTSVRLRPEMRMIELYEEWRAKRRPTTQTAVEYQTSVADFINYVGDLTVAEITADDILNYANEAEKLPANMPRADRYLPFRERVARHAPDKNDDRDYPPRISPYTLKKRVGAIQAMLSFAKEQRWLSTNVGRDLSLGSAKHRGLKRLSFEEDQLATLFAQPLFLRPDRWSWRHRTTDCTLYWLFLICCTTSARIEEIGQALLTDVKRQDDILYIDIDDYSGEAEDHNAHQDRGGKSLTTASSRRLVPIHDRVKALGFADHCVALRGTGQVRLFPALARFSAELNR